VPTRLERWLAAALAFVFAGLSMAQTAEAPTATVNLSAVLRRFDLDRNGQIDANEASAMNAALAADSRRPIARLDTDGDGVLGADEIAALNERLAAMPKGGDRKGTSARQKKSPPPSIDCAAGKGRATLSWTAPTQNEDGTPLRDLAGYVIRYGPGPKSLACTAQVKDASATKHVIEQLAAGAWYFTVAAVNRQGVMSPAGAMVSKTIE
jgi:hypothetical protein